jgi:hypothetical protein
LMSQYIEKKIIVEHNIGSIANKQTANVLFSQ